MRALRLSQLLCLAFLTVLTTHGPADAEVRGRGDGDRIIVMTRNMYFGADLTPAILATTPAELFAAVAHIFGVVNASDIPDRVDRIAAEIAHARPDLVGLQEVATWRTQFPPDFSPTPDAPTVVYDFLQILLDGLAARGEHYVVAATHLTNDIEAPGLILPAGTCCIEVRLTEREVMLVRADSRIRLSNVQDGTFVAQVAFALPGSPAPYVETRGWIAADVRRGDDRFRFITTHLLAEGIFDPVQVAQGAELVSGPASTRLPVVLVCDCNSRADNTGTETYVNLLAAGFDDAWVERHPHRPGLTCCQAEDLRNPVSSFDQRIDLILVLGRAAVTHVFRTGDRQGDRTEAGLWPSDHAGVVGTLLVR